MLSAKQLGAERILLKGRHTARTDLGVEFGATDVVAERGAEGVAKVMDLTDGEGSHIVPWGLPRKRMHGAAETRFRLRAAAMSCSRPTATMIRSYVPTPGLSMTLATAEVRAPV